MKPKARFTVLWLAALLFACAGTAAASEVHAESADALRVTIRVNAANVLHSGDRRRLLGSNLAVWNKAEIFPSDLMRDWIADVGLNIMRMPGGSWSDILFWNGHGVRNEAGEVDLTRMKDGWPTVDYSSYEQSFAMEAHDAIKSDGWHGHVGVKELHEFITSLPGCDALVTVNAGSGRPLDAAEWVRWANKLMGYGVRYWEVGNELEGSWELGSTMRDGGRMTAEIYAQRFREFAAAMKAVDPTIEVGGPAAASSRMPFGEALLRDAGDQVDFFTWHTYPLRRFMTEDEMFAVAEHDVAGAAERARGWIRQYQPDREGEIELGITEWNLSTDGGWEVDMFAAAWTAAFIGEMQRNGVDFANQWDAFTHIRGGSLVFTDEPPVRKAQYWAFWLWNHCMGDSVVECTKEGAESVRLYATKSEDAVCLMAINPSRWQEAELAVQLEGFEPAAQGEEALLSYRQCFWNWQAERMEWSSPPLALPVDVGRSFTTTVPPLAVKCIRIPAADRPGVSERALQGRQMLAQPHGPVELRLIVPPSAYDDTDLGGWVLAYRAGTDEPYPVPLPPARIEVSGPAAPARPEVRLAEAAGQFLITPSGAGQAVVTARLGDATASATAEFTAAEPRPHLVWDFETDPPAGRRWRPVDSHWELAYDDTVRANQRVARVQLDNAVPEGEGKQNLLMLMMPWRSDIRRENVRGVFFEVRASDDLRCDDPDARIEVMMWSMGGPQMSLGTVPLPKAGEDWQKHTLMVTDRAHIAAMGRVVGMAVVLHSKAPVTGSLFFDEAGLMVR